MIFKKSTYNFETDFDSERIIDLISQKTSITFNNHKKYTGEIHDKNIDLIANFDNSESRKTLTPNTSIKIDSRNIGSKIFIEFKLKALYSFLLLAGIVNLSVISCVMYYNDSSTTLGKNTFWIPLIFLAIAILVAQITLINKKNLILTDLIKTLKLKKI